MNIHFTSRSDDWATPQWLFDALDTYYGFDLDVCATEHNAKCAKYFTVNEDGLTQEWEGVVWMNPPYGRGIGKWVHKARQAATENNATVVCLLPARTDTAWWQDNVPFASEIHFVRGRLKFGKAKYNAPFPSALVVFRKRVAEVLTETLLKD